MRPALRVDDLFEPAENTHAGKHLRETRVGLSSFSYRCDKLAIFELDAVHGNVHLGHVNAIVLAVAQVVIEGLIGAVVADIAEEGTERTVVIERKGERQDRAG